MGCVDSFFFFSFLFFSSNIYLLIVHPTLFVHRRFRSCVRKSAGADRVLMLMLMLGPAIAPAPFFCSSSMSACAVRSVWWYHATTSGVLPAALRADNVARGIFRCLHSACMSGADAPEVAAWWSMLLRSVSCVSKSAPFSSSKSAASGHNDATWFCKYAIITT